MKCEQSEPEKVASRGAGTVSRFLLASAFLTRRPPGPRSAYEN